MMEGRFDECNVNPLIYPLFADLKFSLSSLSCQRDRSISVPLTGQSDLCPDRIQVSVPLTGERWLCPVNGTDKSTGAAVTVQPWAAIFMSRICPVNGTGVSFYSHPFYTPVCPVDGTGA